MPFQVIESWKTFLFKAVWMDGQRCQVCLDGSNGVPYADGSKQGLGRPLFVESYFI
jgi:hypothetical protein